MHARHQAIVDEALTDVARDPEAIGLLLAGSLARGDAHPGSDVDLRVLLAAGHVRAFRSEFHRGIVVEQSYADVALAEAHLGNNPMEVYAYLDGRILHDPTGALARLAEVARQRFSAYHAPSEERAAIAYWLRSARLKMAAARALEDGGGARGGRPAAGGLCQQHDIVAASDRAVGRERPPHAAERCRLGASCRSQQGAATGRSTPGAPIHG